MSSIGNIFNRPERPGATMRPAPGEGVCVRCVRVFAIKRHTNKKGVTTCPFCGQKYRRDVPSKQRR